MLLVYLMLFLALSFVATWWRVTNYQRMYKPICNERRVPRSR